MAEAGDSMSKPLLRVGSNELPKCACSNEMQHEATEGAGSDTEIQIFDAQVVSANCG